MAKIKKFSRAVVQTAKLFLLANITWVGSHFIQNLACPLKPGQTRRGKNLYTVPMPNRRNQSVSVALQDFFRTIINATKKLLQNPLVIAFCEEALSISLFLFDATGLAALLKKIKAIFEARTETWLRWR